MGGKARTAFQVVLWGAALWASGGAASAAMPWLAPTLGVASAVYGSWVAKEARRKAENAAWDAQQDRRAMLRSAAAAKYYVFGTAWVPSVVVGHRSPVSKDDPYFWLVLALPVAHEIHGYSGIFFGEHELQLDANGVSTSPQFSREITNTMIYSGIVPSNNLVTVPSHPADSADDIMQIIGNIQVGIRNPFSPGPHNPDTHQDIIKPDAFATLVANTRNVIQIHNAAPGDHFTLTYSYKFTRSYIRAWRYTGTSTQQANAEMIAATANEPFGIRWSASDRLQDIPYVVFRIHVDKDIFINGLENISFCVYGMKVFDPRTGNTAWSHNPILAAREYALRECDVLPTQIDQALIEAEASVCDEPIPLPPGEPNEHPAGSDANPMAYRFDCNIALSTEATPQENLGAILATCDGSAVPSGPTFDIRAGHYEPPIMALDDSDFVTPPTVIKGMARPDLFNQVRARFTNHRKPFWPLDDAPPYESQVYAEQDRRVITRELDLVGVVRPYTAHRLIKQILHKARQGMRVQATFNIRSFQLAPEQSIYLTSRSLGIIGKVFRIKTYKPVSLDTVEIDMQEDTPYSYQWDFTESAKFDPAPNTSLPPVGFVPAIQQLQAFTNVDAATFGPDGELTPQCRVTWAPVTNVLVLNGGHIEIRHKRKQDIGWALSPFLVPTAAEYRFPCRYGDFLIIEARLANAVAKGPWTQITKIADDTPTEHLTGNLLYNAGFEWTDMYGAGEWSTQYQWPGWRGGLSYPVYFSSEQTWGPMTVYRYDEDADPSTEPAHVGIIRITDLNGVTGVPWHHLPSDKMQVTPGDNMLVFASAFAVNARAFIQVDYFDRQGNNFHSVVSMDVPLSAKMIAYQQYAELPAGGVVPGPDPADFVRTHLFNVVPAGAAFASIRLVGVRLGTVAPNRRASVFWWRPYYGRASRNQVTIPNWTKI